MQSESVSRTENVIGECFEAPFTRYWSWRLLRCFWLPYFFLFCRSQVIV